MMMMKTALTVLSTLALGGLVYACSSDDGGGSSSGGVDGGGSSSSSGGSSSGGSSSGGSSSGGSSSSSSSSGGEGGKPNPIEGAAAPSDALGAAVVADGLQWKVGTPSLLYFTQPLLAPDGDIVTHDPTIVAPMDPNLEVKQPAGTAIGLALDKAKALIGCETKPVGRVVRYDGAMNATEIAKEASGVAMDSPNDLVVRKSDGLIFVTDPGYQVATPTKNRIYKITNATPAVATKIDEFATLDRPNGIALSPDEKTLYVSITEPQAGGAKPFVRKYTVAANGDISAPASFATFDVAASPDGVTTDDDGNVFVATLSGVEVFKPDGSKWGVLAVPGGKATNVRHGGADRKTLYISTPQNVLKTTVKVAGRAD